MGKRITFIISSLSGGGAEGVCVNLANGLSERNWQVTLVVLHLNNAVRQNDLKPEIQLIVLGKNHARTVPIALAKFLRKHKPTDVLVFNHQLAVLLVLLRSFFSWNFKITARNISTLSHKKIAETSFWHKYIVQGLTSLFYGKVDRVIAQSQGMANDLFFSYRVPKDKIVVIYNPVNPAIEKHSLPNHIVNKDYLLCVGRLEPVKAFHQAILAFSMISPDHPALRLKIVGKGSLESDLKKQAATLGVIEKIDFEGYQTNVIPYYIGARATILTSLYEGFPNVLVESIALGTPVVAFNCPSGPSEIVVDGLNGFLVEQYNLEQLVQCINIVLNTNWDPCVVSKTASCFSSNKIISSYESLLIK